MKKFTLSNLDDLAIGAAILGSGGGGDTAYPYMHARTVFDKWGPSTLITTAELKADDYVLTIGYIGAPLAESEKIFSGREFNIIINQLEQTVQKKVTALLPLEIGGGNAFSPFVIAPELGIPIVDADAMGRAFPEAQMCSCGLLGASVAPAFITDCLGNSVVIYANNTMTVEKIGRQITVAMGSIAGCGLYPMSGAQVPKMTLDKSISKAVALGKASREAKEKGQDPISAILQTCKGMLLGNGKITDVDRVIRDGFIKGSIVIQNKSEYIELFFQNEFLLAKINGKVVATTPDILTLLEVDTGLPITSESMRYGLKVNLIALPSPPLWTTQEGLALVGPRHFGYEMDYTPFHKVKQHANAVGVAV